MENSAQMLVPRVKLGSQGLEVSKLGFGCMNLSGFYSASVTDEFGISIIKHAFDNGITFFDTSDSYGRHKNEILIGKALKQLPREKIQIATKFGVQNVNEHGEFVVNGKPEYVRACCEGSLRRLGLDCIDLYYQHRIDKTVPIEETIEELKNLVKEGKIKYIGLSEASADTIRRAHAVHPISAVQIGWSLWFRETEEEIIPVCRELGIGIVPHSPLGNGFFGGKGVTENVLPNVQAFIPRFCEENISKNKVIYGRVQNLAKKHHCTPAQLALSWVLHQGNDVVPIPGTTKLKNLDENIGSLKLSFTKEELKEISDAVPAEEVAGSSYAPNLIIASYKYADTPPRRIPSA